MSDKGSDNILFLEDILEAIEKIYRYTRDLTFDEFRNDGMVVDAVIRNLEIIGEASKNIPKRLRGKYPEIAWKEAAGFRDVLIHDYFGIDVESVWDTIKTNIPEFKEGLLGVLKNETGSIDSKGQ
jgi:uncharacterized protein with HEPN domain